MRFTTKLTNILTFSKLTASLSSLGKVCWMRLEDNYIRFTIIPDQGTQVWAQLPVESIFDESTYTIESNSGVINLEIPIGNLHRALRSAIDASSANLRLTKKGNIPLLALTVHSSSWTAGSNAIGLTDSASSSSVNPHPTDRDRDQNHQGQQQDAGSGGPRERETVITQEIPVKVLHESGVEGLHEPRCREPDVHIILPSLMQVKSISERFNKLASLDKSSSTSSVSISASAPTSTSAAGGSNATAVAAGAATSPKLELSANMHGSLKLAIATDSLRISSVWSGLSNPEVNTETMSQGEIDRLPSERRRAMGESEEGWAKVRIDGRDWGRVLSVGRLSPKVVASFIHETALVLYVYLPGSWNGEDSCLTYYINSYSA